MSKPIVASQSRSKEVSSRKALHKDGELALELALSMRSRGRMCCVNNGVIEGRGQRGTSVGGSGLAWSCCVF